MTWRGSVPLTLIGKVMLALVAAGAITIPLVIGVLRAQTLPAPPEYTYAVVSIHPSKPGQPGSRIGPGPSGGLRTENTTTMLLLTWAYSVRPYQIEGAPSWVNSERFDISLTPDRTEIKPEKGMPVDDLMAHMKRNQQRMQAVLRDRFGLVLRAETREVPIYALVVAKGGPKMTSSRDPKLGPSLNAGQTGITAVGVRLEMLASHLSAVLGRPVKDETGLGDTQYDFKLDFAPDISGPPGPDGAAGAAAAAEDDRPSIFTAVTEQLGLRLEPRRGPAPVYVVEKIEKPSDN
jgi:uncharacterized protein (TIGR03435 family)